jgi:hypothetical protein
MQGTRKDSSSADGEPVSAAPAERSNAKTRQVADSNVQPDARPPCFDTGELLNRSERQHHACEGGDHRRNDKVTDAELVGRFQYGTLLRNRPRTLATWCVTATSTRTVDRIAQLLGGHPRHDPASGHAEVVTASAMVDILLPDLHALRVRWYGSNGRVCNGAAQDKGCPCACPSTLAQRRSVAKQGRGCKPLVELRFRLLDDPALGTFILLSDDWSFVEMVIEALAALKGTDHSTIARLAIQRTLHTLRSGRVLAYTRPTLIISNAQPPSHRGSW